MRSNLTALRDQCSIARAGDLIGDAWTLMLLRELFWRSTRYEQLAENTGMASNVLAQRLRKLVDKGIVTKTVVENDARRFDYTLTPKGLDLFPMVMAVMAWGDRWSSGDAGPLIELHHTVCGKKTLPGTVCSACGEPLAHDTIRAEVTEAYQQAD